MTSCLFLNIIVNKVIHFIESRRFSITILSCRLLGEPCDAKLLTQHHKKLSGHVQPQYGMDFKSESAAIYFLVSWLLMRKLFNIFLFQVIATLYLVMVLVMLGMHYKLKERKKRKGKEKKEKEGNEKQTTNSSSVSFTDV